MTRRQEVFEISRETVTSYLKSLVHPSKMTMFSLSQKSGMRSSPPLFCLSWSGQVLSISHLRDSHAASLLLFGSVDGTVFFRSVQSTTIIRPACVKVWNSSLSKSGLIAVVKYLQLFLTTIQLYKISKCVLPSFEWFDRSEMAHNSSVSKFGPWPREDSNPRVDRIHAFCTGCSTDAPESEPTCHGIPCSSAFRGPVVGAYCDYSR